MAKKTYWTRGDRTALALSAGVRLRYLCDILKRRRRLSTDFAFRLEKAATKIGLHIPAEAWLGLKKHPAFFD